MGISDECGGKFGAHMVVCEVMVLSKYGARMGLLAAAAWLWIVDHTLGDWHMALTDAKAVRRLARDSRILFVVVAEVWLGVCVSLVSRRFVLPSALLVNLDLGRI